MKIAITGANGFIGRHVVSEALNQNFDVLAITRQAKESYLANFLVDHPETNIDRLDVRECNLYESKDINETLAGCDSVIHLAAAMEAGDDAHKKTLAITKNIIDGINHNNIKTLLLVSSISVLDYIQQNANATIDEKTPLCNDDSAMGHYAIMKRDQEKLCQQWQRETGKQLITVRPGLVYSDQQLSDSHAGFIKKGVGITVKHEGQVPLIRVDQVGREIVLLLSHSVFAKDIFHSIGRPPISQHDYLEQLKRQDILKFSLPLPWKTYDCLGQLIRWLLTKAKKEDKVPDSFKINSIAARQKPFIFSSNKISQLLK
ncbi:MAG: NAD-dependent epimerase/dehydratase family protein [Cellvibrionaceae bacterium]